MNQSTGHGSGSLIAVGTGIRIVGQLTTEAIAWMRRADRLLYVVADAVSEAAILQLNPERAESLRPLYAEGMPRLATYDRMANRILTCVREGMVTCAACYGHPGVFADPIHEAIRRVRAEGYPAQMLPAISAEDCLFADMGIDPARDGCQSYDATDFLLHKRKLDATAGVVLWQIGIVGDPLYRAGPYNLSLLPLLIKRLGKFYCLDHVAYVYEAAMLPGAAPSIRPAPLESLPSVNLSSMSTLYIPPARLPTVDRAVWRRIEAMTNAGRPQSTAMNSAAVAGPACSSTP
jgi:uncharacterized protein YabN with tetrapyrrole methylase and pyrophosphatase domain